MGGGLMQLVAYGAQDVYLTGNPQITFFKVVYRRHTNFAVEAIEQTFNGSPDFGKKASVQITRNGDLITKMYLKATLENSITTTQSVMLSGDTAVTTGVYVDATATTTSALVVNTVKTAAGVITSIGRFSNAAFVVGAVVQLSTSEDVADDGYYQITAASADSITVAGGAATLTANTTDDTLVIAVHPHVEWVRDVGYALIKSVELQIGGTKIDKHYGVWMHIWNELSKNHSLDKSHHAMIGNKSDGTSDLSNSLELFVPLQFFCCRNDGLALPLIALQYHDVRVEFEFDSAANCCSSGDASASISNANLLVDYIYLDSEERKRFAQASHEYLIEQLQYTGVESGVSGTGNKFRLNFNHPCKELVWAVRKSGDTSNAKFVNLTNNNTISSGLNTVDDAQLQLNGHDRMSKQNGTYFQNVQVRAHHSNTSDNAGINVYSFALNPEEHQPSGTCNFSRIDNAQLNMTLNTAGDVHIFATSYNVLRIMSGMGGLAYSN